MSHSHLQLVETQVAQTSLLTVVTSGYARKGGHFLTLQYLPRHCNWRQWLLSHRHLQLVDTPVAPTYLLNLVTSRYTRTEGRFLTLQYKLCEEGGTFLTLEYLPRHYNWRYWPMWHSHLQLVESGWKHIHRVVSSTFQLMVHLHAFQQLIKIN